MNVVRYGWLLGLILALIGCEEKVGDGSKKAQEDPAAQDASKPKKVTVELLDAGPEPRRVLRYDFSEVKKQSMEMLMEMSMAMDIGEHSQPLTSLPPVRMAMDVAPEKVSESGSLRYKFKLNTADVVESPGMDKQTADRMRAELQKTVGMSGWAEVSTRGFTSDADIKVPAGAGAEVQDLVSKMRSQIEQMSAPLPEEAVGVGGSWVVTQPITSPMVEITQKATYTLKKLEGNVATLDVSLKQTAPKQKLDSSTLGGASAWLTKLDSGGSGVSQIDLRQLVPVAQVGTDMTMEIDVRQAGQQQEWRMRIRIEMTIGPK